MGATGPCQPQIAAWCQHAAHIEWGQEASTAALCLLNTHMARGSRTASTIEQMRQVAETCTQYQGRQVSQIMMQHAADSRVLH